MADRGDTYHCLPFRGQMLAIITASALVLGGCAKMQIPLASLSGSVAEPASLTSETEVVSALSDLLSDSDVTMIGSVLATAMTEAEDGATVSWNNPETGASGSLIPLVVARADGGLLCRAFVGTLGAADTGQKFRGEACRLDDGNWQLMSMAAGGEPG